MGYEDKILIGFLEFIVSPKKYLEEKVFLKNNLDYELRIQEYEKDLKRFKQENDIYDSFCSKGHPCKASQHYSYFDEKRKQTIDGTFCLECYLIKEKKELEILKTKLKKEKKYYSYFKICFPISILFLFTIIII